MTLYQYTFTVPLPEGSSRFGNMHNNKISSLIWKLFADEQQGVKVQLLNKIVSAASLTNTKLQIALTFECTSQVACLRIWLINFIN